MVVIVMFMVLVVNNGNLTERLGINWSLMLPIEEHVKNDLSEVTNHTTNSGIWSCSPRL